MNWYNYVKSDPVNSKDPSGTETTVTAPDCGKYQAQPRCFDGHPDPLPPFAISLAGFSGEGGGGGPGDAPRGETPLCRDIRKRSEDARSRVPRRVADPKVWNDPAAL